MSEEPKTDHGPSPSEHGATAYIIEAVVASALVGALPSGVQS